MEKYPSLGCDPEWFLQTESGKVVSAIGKIGGTKQEPRVLFTEKIRGKEVPFCVQEDNVLLEYNIPPATCKSEWLDFNLLIQSKINEELKKQGLKPLIVPSYIMPKEEMDNPFAWVFGCDPDYNAWTRKPNPNPTSQNKFLRSAGGHIHIGFKGNKEDKIRFVKLLDLFLDAPLMLMDKDRRRQELYGKPGAFRFKPYGIEYRTPSNFWTHSLQTMDMVYNCVMMAWKNFYKFEVPDEVQQILLRGNEEEILEMVNKYVYASL